MGIPELYSLYLEHPNVSTDTRTMSRGDLFFCLKGESFDGNAFAEEALKRGASYVVVDNPCYAKGEKYILVDNVLQTLQDLAAFKRQRLEIPVLGITGTNGKTTTKELIAAVLSKKYRVCYTKGNFNNHIGVPLTLLSMRGDSEIAVVEMGASHPHEIEDLCNISMPDMALITNIGKAHLEGFGSFENIIETKTALYRFVLNKRGLLFVNGDDDLLCSLSSKAKRRVTYGISENSDFVGIPGGSSLHFSFSVPKDNCVVNTCLVGDYNFYNLMSAYAFGRYFGIEARDIKDALENYIPSNSRSQIVEKSFCKVILDAYNANPSSMFLSLRNFEGIDSDSKYLVLGDMRELGAESLKEHQNIVNLIKEMGFSNVYLLGEEFLKTTAPDEWKYDSMESLSESLQKSIKRGSFVFIKGSRGMQMERVLNYLND